MTIHDILKKAEAELPKPDPSKDVLTYFLRQGWHEAIEFIRAEIDKAVVSAHDPIAGVIGSVEYDKMRIITESGFLVANVRAFDLVQHSEGIFQDDFGQWIADAINEKISRSK